MELMKTIIIISAKNAIQNVPNVMIQIFVMNARMDIIIYISMKVI